MGRIISVNIARATSVHWKGRQVQTAFFKRSTPEEIEVGALALAGDEQADHRYHGGPDQAVYVYASENYEGWKRRLGVRELHWGSFGENLTIEGYPDAEVRLGDVFRAGSSLLQVTKPREPCYKLNVRFQRDDAVKLFADAELPGFYCRVVAGGRLRGGDVFERAQTDAGAVELVRAFRRSLHRE